MGLQTIKKGGVTDHSYNVIDEAKYAQFENCQLPKNGEPQSTGQMQLGNDVPQFCGKQGECKKSRKITGNRVDMAHCLTGKKRCINMVASHGLVTPKYRECKKAVTWADSYPTLRIAEYSTDTTPTEESDRHRADDCIRREQVIEYEEEALVNDIDEISKCDWRGNQEAGNGCCNNAKMLESTSPYSRSLDPYSSHPAQKIISRQLGSLIDSANAASGVVDTNFEYGEEKTREVSNSIAYDDKTSNIRNENGMYGTVSGKMEAGGRQVMQSKHTNVEEIANKQLFSNEEKIFDAERNDKIQKMAAEFVDCNETLQLNPMSQDLEHHIQYHNDTAAGIGNTSMIPCNPSNAGNRDLHIEQRNLSAETEIAYCKSIPADGDRLYAPHNISMSCTASTNPVTYAKQTLNPSVFGAYQLMRLNGFTPLEQQSCTLIAKMNEFMKRPARRQANPAERRKIAYMEGNNEYNIWYGKYLSDRYEKSWRDREPRPSKCDPDKDCGHTKSAKYEQYSCIYFAWGCCTQGSNCMYKHVLPTELDEYTLEPSHDIFGRERFANHRDDMGGVGSFNSDCKTLFVGGLTVDKSAPNAMQNLEIAVRKEFEKWGIIENLRCIPKKNIAFVTYTCRVFAEFAKEAMADQDIGYYGKLLSVKWAHKDGNSASNKQLNSAMNVYENRCYSGEQQKMGSSNGCTGVITTSDGQMFSDDCRSISSYPQPSDGNKSWLDGSSSEIACLGDYLKQVVNKSSGQIDWAVTAWNQFCNGTDDGKRHAGLQHVLPSTASNATSSNYGMLANHNALKCNNSNFFCGGSNLSANMTIAIGGSVDDCTSWAATDSYDQVSDHNQYLHNFPANSDICDANFINNGFMSNGCTSKSECNGTSEMLNSMNTDGDGEDMYYYNYFDVNYGFGTMNENKYRQQSSERYLQSVLHPKYVPKYFDSIECQISRCGSVSHYNVIGPQTKQEADNEFHEGCVIENICRMQSLLNKIENNNITVSTDVND